MSCVWHPALCEAATWSKQALGGVSWLEVLKTVAPVLTAWIAWRALKNWRRQDRAKIQAQVLDDLIETTHRFAEVTERPFARIHIAQLGFRAYQYASEATTPEDVEIDGAAGWIDKNGREYAKSMELDLEPFEALMAKLRTLETKARVFQFPKATKLTKGIQEFASISMQCHSFVAVVHSENWTWDVLEVREVVLNAARLNPDAMRKRVQEAKLSITEFVEAGYRKIYG